MKKVTVIITNYNFQDYLVQCIDSVLSQNYTNIEIIIVDDKSTDGSTDIVKLYQNKDERIKIVVHQENKGLFNSIKEALDISTGDYIMRIDGDDYLLDNSISKKVKIMEENDLAFVYSDFQVVDEYNNIKEHDFNLFHTQDFIGNDFPSFAQGNPAIASGTLVNFKYKEYIYKYIWDWYLWLILSRDYNIGYVSDKLVAYRVHSQSAMRTMSLDKIYENKNLLDWLNYTVLFINDIFQDLPKRQIKYSFLRKKALSHVYRNDAYLIRHKHRLLCMKLLVISFWYDPVFFIVTLKNYFLKVIS